MFRIPPSSTSAMGLVSTIKRISKKIYWNLHSTGLELRRMLDSMENARFTKIMAHERIFAIADNGCGKMQMQ